VYILRRMCMQGQAVFEERREKSEFYLYKILVIIVCFYVEKLDSLWDSFPCIF